MRDSLFPWEGWKPSPGPRPDAYEARMTRLDWLNYYRPRILARAAGRCERCGKKTRRPEVHHLTYERLGREKDEDLQAVCRDCHPTADKERARMNRRDSSDGFEEWCAAVYGDEEPPEDARERFDSFVRRKESGDLEDYS